MTKIENILQALLENLEEGIHIVDNNGRTIYYNGAMGRMEGLNPEDVIGKKVNEYLNGVEDDSSTLMSALSTKKKIVDVLQHYSSHFGKKVTSINTTIPVIVDGNTVAAVEIAKDMTQLKELNEKLIRLQNFGNSDVKHYIFKDIIGKSEAIMKAVNIARKASLTNSSVLIYGETGSGKEVFAQSIHYNGTRKDKPFVAINCAAIPSALLEGMLFGTVKGSFTGAENKKGLFEEADGGTLLLDEVNSMEPYLQSKLLRVLQDGYIRPVGSNNVIDVNVRVVASLNEEPSKLIDEGKLRKDFYYRLSVIRINIPPLRERKEDIPLLCSHFLEYYNDILSKNIREIEDSVLINFMNYDWPGNIRELKNVIESAMNMVESSVVLTKELFESKPDRLQSPGALIKNSFNNNESLQEYLEDIEEKIIRECFSRNAGNISKTAKELKISRQNLQYKLKKYKLLENGQ